MQTGLFPGNTRSSFETFTPLQDLGYIAEGDIEVAIKTIVQLGPGLKSKTKALDQSRTLNSLWTTTTTHPPPLTTHLPKTF